MSKHATTILIFRILQTALIIAFLVFWTWSAAKFTIGGGPGEYFLGYLTSLLSLAICIHGIYGFIKKHHQTQHRARYHNARWAIDLGIVCLWLGVVLIMILVPVPLRDQDRALNGPPSTNEDASDAILVVGMGVNFTSLFAAITFFMTALLLVVPAVRARKVSGAEMGQTEKGEGRAVEGVVVETGVRVPPRIYNGSRGLRASRDDVVGSA